jgi:hypothetical protein
MESLVSSICRKCSDLLAYHNLWLVGRETHYDSDDPLVINEHTELLMPNDTLKKDF